MGAEKLKSSLGSPEKHLHFIGYLPLHYQTSLLISTDQALMQYPSSTPSLRIHSKFLQLKVCFLLGWVPSSITLLRPLQRQGPRCC